MTHPARPTPHADGKAIGSADPLSSCARSEAQRIREEIAELAKDPNCQGPLALLRCNETHLGANVPTADWCNWCTVSWLLQRSEEARDEQTRLTYELAQADIALAAARQEEGWQPIETAPKGMDDIGRSRLVYCQGNKCAYTAHWTGEAWAHFAGGGEERLLFYDPSHWQPLPPAPSEPEADLAAARLRATPHEQDDKS